MAAKGYLIQPKCGIPGLSKQLCQTLALSSGQQHSFRRHYLDSFDWRLLYKGYSLQAEHHDDSILLQLFRLHDQQLISQQQLAQLPRLAADLGQSKLATLLAPILDVRALLPQIETRVTQRRLHQLNGQDKLTAELCLEQISTPQTQQALKLLLHTPIKGYDKENRSITKFLARQEQLKATVEAPLQQLLSRLDIDTGYHSKHCINLDPHGRSDLQIKQLLQFFLHVMRHNETGIIEDIDSEFVHDYRIAVRRSRTLLDQVPDIMPRRTLTRISKQLAQLGANTTPLRDLDVMLLNFDEYRGLLPNKLRNDLDPALAFIKQQRQQAHKQLRRYLQSNSYTGLCQRWQTFLQTAAPASTPLSNAKRPLKEVTDERIWKSYKKVLKQGKAITDQSPAEDLHSLRKTCKKLRYLLEFFRSLYPSKKLKALIAILKQLQDNLGEFQDIHVHIDFFRRLNEEMQQANQLDDSTHHAIDKVIAALDIQQAECRKTFQGRFKKFSRPAHQQHFKQLFKP